MILVWDLLSEFYIIVLASLSALAGLYLVFRVLKRWRYGVVCAFVLLYIEDSIRKIIPGQPLPVVFFKDGLLGLTYFSLFFADFIKYYDQKLRVPMRLVIAAWVLWVFVLLAGTPVQSWLVHAALIRTHLFFIPLLYVGYRMFDEVEELERFLRIVVFFSIPCISVGFIQMIYGYDYILKYFPEILAKLLLPIEGGHIYHSHYHQSLSTAVSIFAGSGRFGHHVLVFFLLSLGLLFSPLAKYKKVVVLSVIFSLIGIVISGKRMHLLIALVVVVYFFYCLIRSNRESARKTGLAKMIRVVPLSLIVCTIFFFSWDSVSETNKHRTDFFLSVSSEVPIRYRWLKAEINHVLELTDWVKFRMGFYGQEAQLLPKPVDPKLTLTSDSGIARILAEGGYAHLFMFSLLWCSSIYHGRKSVWLLRANPLFTIALCLFSYQLATIPLLTKGHGWMSDPAVLMPFWFFSGVLIKMSEWVRVSVGHVNVVEKQS